MRVARLERGRRTRPYALKRLNSRIIYDFSRNPTRCKQHTTHGRHPTCPRRRQEAPLLQRGRHRFAQPSRRPLHRARRLLQPDRHGERGRRCAFRIDRISYWQERGAKLSDTVAGLVKKSAPKAAPAVQLRRQQPLRRDSELSRRWAPTTTSVMGRVVAPYGVKGWVKVHAYRKTARCSITTRGGSVHGRIRCSGCCGNSGGERSGWRESWRRVVARARRDVVAQLAGVADREAAARAQGRGHRRAARRAAGRAEENEIYWADLVGLAVVNRQGVRLGRWRACRISARIRCLLRHGRGGGGGAADPVRCRLRRRRRSPQAHRRRLAAGLLKRGNGGAHRRRHAVSGDGGAGRRVMA